MTKTSQWHVFSMWLTSLYMCIFCVAPHSVHVWNAANSVCVCLLLWWVVCTLFSSCTDRNCGSLADPPHLSSFFNSSLSIPNYRPYPSSHSSFASTNHWHLDASSVFAIVGHILIYNAWQTWLANMRGNATPQIQVKQKQNCVNWILVNPKRRRKSQKHTHQKWSADVTHHTCHQLKVNCKDFVAGRSGSSSRVFATGNTETGIVQEHPHTLDLRLNTSTKLIETCFISDRQTNKVRSFHSFGL